MGTAPASLTRRMLRFIIVCVTFAGSVALGAAAGVALYANGTSLSADVPSDRPMTPVAMAPARP